jgi:large subunit ribosomal protein L15
MRLNTLAPAEGANNTGKRVGRGIGSGLGKTGGRGHKGQKSRSVGFTSRKSFVSDQVTLSEIAKVEGDIVSLETLKAAGLVKKEVLFVKVMKSGEINRPVTLSGVRVSKGALEAINAAGGKVEE